MTLSNRTTRTRRLAAALALAALGAGASAQQVYRIVGPDGRVTFSDKPPAEAGAKVAPAGPVARSGGADAGGGGALPFELRQIASRYPVTLYTGPDCPPCNQAKNYLQSRGVPHNERTVSTQEDLGALQRLSGGVSMPFLTIGSQQIAGFSDVEWSQFLDAAGYPRTSQLPPGYRNPPATPLVAAAVARPAAPAAVQQQPAPAQQQAPQPAPLPPGDNPAGITF